MGTGVRPWVTGDFASFTLAQLDGSHFHQNLRAPPAYALGVRSNNERELRNQCIWFLTVGEKGANAQPRFLTSTGKPGAVPRTLLEKYITTQAPTALRHGIKILRTEVPELCYRTGYLPASCIAPKNCVQTTKDSTASG